MTAEGTVITATPGAAPVAPPKRARMTLTRIDPWSVMKLALVLSLAAAVVMLVAVFVLWLMLDLGGVFSSVSTTLGDIGLGDTFSVNGYLGIGRIMVAALLLSVVDVVLLTALATLGAFLYNLAVGVVGGIEVSFTEQP